MNNNKLLGWQLAAFGSLLLVVLVTGAWFYRIQNRELHNRAIAELQAMAELKVNQIAAWRESLLADALLLMKSPFLVEGIQLWLETPTADGRERILTRFRDIQKHKHYFDVLLTDPAGRVCLRVRDGSGALHPQALRLLKEAFNSRKPLLSEIHRGTDGLPPHLDVIVPLFLQEVDDDRPMGGIILQIDARQYLYPLIQSWPTPSASAETLLVKQDQGDILYLNDLRHQADAALNLRVPMSQSDLTAGMAARGGEGAVEGKDYRGIPVLAVLKAIPDSPWFLVAKIDHTEIFAAWRLLAALILALMVFIVLTMAAGMGLIVQQKQKAHYRALSLSQASLVESQERFRQLFTQMLEGFALHEILYDHAGRPADYRFLQVNPAFEEMTGLKARNLLGKTVREALPNIEPEWIEAYDQVAATGQPVRFESHSRNIDRYYRVSAFCPARGTMAVAIEDITAFRQTEVEKDRLQEQLFQAQKMEAIGILAGGIAHDFNNILFPIIGFTEMMLDQTSEGSPDQESLDEVLKASLRARDLVQQILTFSRQSEKELRPLRMQHIIKEILKLVKASIPSTIRIKQHIDPNCGMVLADPTNIHQIAMNLITNACHAMEAEGGTLTITLSEARPSQEDLKELDIEPGTFACLSIADTGHGIEKPILNRIFEPYFTTKPEGKGTGLGLSVVHGIVKSAKGCIRVKSEPGDGAVFDVYLPVCDSKAEKEAVNPLAISGGTENIMLVDDEEVIVRMEKQLLESLGYCVTACTSSEDALEAFQSSPDQFDLVLTDMTMPGMTGEKLALAVKKIRHEVPVIVCTGFSEKITPEKIEALGIEGLLFKPIAKLDLAQKIRSLLDIKKEDDIPYGQYSDHR